MPSPTLKHTIAAALLAMLIATGAAAQDNSAWERPQRMDLPPAQPDAAAPAPNRTDSYPPSDAQGRRAPRSSRPNDAYVPPPQSRSAWGDGLPVNPPPYPPPAQADGYRPAPPVEAYRDPRGPDPREDPRDGARGAYGTPYQPPSGDTAEDDAARPPPRGRYTEQGGSTERSSGPTYSENEVLDAGHRFFGGISQGLANAVEYVFQQSGRPNGYILGEDAGGAFVAGLRYGEGVLFTKDAGKHRVYWQGPSIGYDFGGEGSKTMVLVYNLRDPSEIYNRFGGVQGSAYLIGGVSVQFQKYGDVVLAPIRSGLGLRLGANVGYLKYTRAPTWNPF